MSPLLLPMLSSVAMSAWHQAGCPSFQPGVPTCVAPDLLQAAGRQVVTSGGLAPAPPRASAASPQQQSFTALMTAGSRELPEQPQQPARSAAGPPTGGSEPAAPTVQAQAAASQAHVPQSPFATLGMAGAGQYQQMQAAPANGLQPQMGPVPVLRPDVGGQQRGSPVNRVNSLSNWVGPWQRQQGHQQQGQTPQITQQPPHLGSARTSFNFGPPASDA